MLASSLKYLVQAQISVFMLEFSHFASSMVFFISFQELISQMLQVNVEARCTAGEILSHPWVSVSTHILGEGTPVSSVINNLLPHCSFCTCRALHPCSLADEMSVFFHECEDSFLGEGSWHEDLGIFDPAL